MSGVQGCAMSIKQPRAGSIFRWIAAFCLALVLLAGTTQALHFHSDQLGGTAKDCPLCVVLHWTAAVVHSVQVSFSFQTTAYLPVSTDHVQISAGSSFALFSRPPPLA